jgi:polysaccharide export outer membrane protein
MALLGLAAFGVAVVASHATDVFAQTAPTSRGYRIVAGDVLQVDVVGRSDISGQFPVDKEGSVTLPILGVVTASGRTTTELGTDISRRISLISRDIPQVTVSIVQAYRRKYFVLGAVLLPGSYSFAKPPTVWEAISEAGGPSDDADASAVQVISESQIAPTIVDVAAAVRAGDMTSLPRLRPGDTVRVPRGAGVRGASGDVIYVFGAVGTQGSQPLSESSDLARALIRSAPGPDANLEDVRIVRRSGPRVVTMRINMKDYLRKASLAGNPELQSGDTIYLSRKASSAGIVRVAGALGVLLGLATSITYLTR